MGREKGKNAKRGQQGASASKAATRLRDGGGGGAAAASFVGFGGYSGRQQLKGKWPAKERREDRRRNQCAGSLRKLALNTFSDGLDLLSSFGFLHRCGDRGNNSTRCFHVARFSSVGIRLSPSAGFWVLRRQGQGLGGVAVLLCFPEPRLQPER